MMETYLTDTETQFIAAMRRYKEAQQAADRISEEAHRVGERAASQSRLACEFYGEAMLLLQELRGDKESNG